jgi:hypothetical protein
MLVANKNASPASYGTASDSISPSKKMDFKPGVYVPLKVIPGATSSTPFGTLQPYPLDFRSLEYQEQRYLSDIMSIYGVLEENLAKTPVSATEAGQEARQIGASIESARYDLENLITGMIGSAFNILRERGVFGNSPTGTVPKIVLHNNLTRTDNVSKLQNMRVFMQLVAEAGQLQQQGLDSINYDALTAELASTLEIDRAILKI